MEAARAVDTISREDTPSAVVEMEPARPRAGAFSNGLRAGRLHRAQSKQPVSLQVAHIPVECRYKRFTLAG